MILTAEQAAALPDPFVIDGYDMTVQDCEGYALNGPMNRAPGPPPPWADLDRPCEAEAPSSVIEAAGWASYVCPDCHGTGRRTVELRGPCRWGGNHTHALGLFTVRVLPIYGPDEGAHEGEWIEMEDGYQNELNDGFDFKRDIALPYDARPGQFAVIPTKVENS